MMPSYPPLPDILREAVYTACDRAISGGLWTREDMNEWKDDLIVRHVMTYNVVPDQIVVWHNQLTFSVHSPEEAVKFVQEYRWYFRLYPPPPPDGVPREYT